MDYLMLALAALAGGLAYHILFGGPRPGPFEQSLMHNLLLGKKVVVCVDSDCYIFELNGDRMRITRGTSTMLEEYDELQSTGVANSDTNKSADDTELGG